MAYPKLILIYVAIGGLIFTHYHNVTAQGCSDAGFCTLGAMRPNQNFSKKLNLKLRSVELSTYYGVTSFYLKVYMVNADVNIGLNSKTAAQIKLPYQYVNGFLANTQGLGDVSLSLSRNLLATEAVQINASVGTKIPTSDANLKVDGRPLPSYYQPSLGTYDAIAGIGISNKNWLFATGFQMPLNDNKNQFLWGAWNKTADSAIAAHYPKSRNLRRGTDVMFRVERNFRFSNWNAYAGILWIQRITQDTFLDTDNKRKPIKGSSGPAITLLTGFGYRFNVHSGIKCMGGMNVRELWHSPYISRVAEQNAPGGIRKTERNPDGLSRAFVCTVGYEYRF